MNIQLIVDTLGDAIQMQEQRDRALNLARSAVGCENWEDYIARLAIIDKEAREFVPAWEKKEGAQ